MARILVTGGSGFIGTNLVEKIILGGNSVLNIDIHEPQLVSQNLFFKRCDLCNNSEVEKYAKEFNPEFVIHLAAKTDTNGKSLYEYAVNDEGTKKLITALAKTEVKRVIFASTQFVHQNKDNPLSDDDYAPHTIYGKSKVVMEKIIKLSNLPYCWTIIRPTNIWGPWHPRYPSEFWKILSQGKYFHPNVPNVIRSYGYVGNVIWQILRILELPEDKVDRKVLYVGDNPVNLYEWVNGFSKALIGKNVRMIPKNLVKAMALFGDLVSKIGLKFPITSSRYKSMTTSNPAPMESTFELLGNPPFSLQEGIEETVKWLKQYYPQQVKI